MKKILSTFFALLVFTKLIFAQETNCDRVAYFGEIEICLPKIEGYQECYLDNNVKTLADVTEVPANMVLGFYLDNETYKKKDSLGNFSFDNYFKVYGTKQIKDYKANSELLKQMQDVLAGSFNSKNWELMKEEVDKIGLEGKIGVPTVIKTYNLSKNSFTYVLLTPYELEGVEPFTMVMTINGLLKNERLIWMAYYLSYDGKETVNKVQEKTNIIISKLLSAKN